MEMKGRSPHLLHFTYVLTNIKFMSGMRVTIILFRLKLSKLAKLAQQSYFL